MADTPWYQLGPSDDSWPPATEPTRATPIGAVETTPFAIYLGSRAMEVIDSRLEHAPDLPFAGLLIGYPLSGPDRRRFLLVTDVIPFALSPEDEGEVRFSPQLFEELFPIWQELPDRGYVVGWCHAAPNRGIALSSFQRFSHHRYFPRPWQVAMIIDAQRHASLLYHRQGAELVPCDAFYYWNMDAEPAAILFESPLLAQDEEPLPVAAAYDSTAVDARSEPRRAPWWVWLLLVLFVYSMIPSAPGSIGWMRRRVSEEADRLSHLKEGLLGLADEQHDLLQQKNTAATQSATTTSSDSSTGGSAAVSSNPSTSLILSTPATPIVTTGSSGPAQGSMGGTLPSDDAAGAAAGTSVRDYVIQPGDTMWSISRTLLGDPQAFRRLAEMNQIDDPDTIFPGQRLQLPED